MDGRWVWRLSKPNPGMPDSHHMTGQHEALSPCYIQDIFGLGGFKSSSSFCAEWWDIKFTNRGRGSAGILSVCLPLYCSDALLQNMSSLSHLLLNALSTCVHHTDCHLCAWNARMFAFSTIYLTSQCLEVVLQAHIQHSSHAMPTGHLKDMGQDLLDKQGIFSCSIISSLHAEIRNKGTSAWVPQLTCVLTRRATIRS